MSLQAEPSAWLFDWHAPEPSQVSASSQSDVDALPHAVPEDESGCAHEPDAHTSFVQSFASAVQPDPSA